MRCPNCLELNSSGNRFCTNCGADLFSSQNKSQNKEHRNSVKEVTEIVKTYDTVAPPVRRGRQRAENVSDIRKASREKRLGAFLIDGCLASIPVVIMFVTVAIIMGNSVGSVENELIEIQVIGYLGAVLLGLILGVIQLVMFLSKGQTIGKRVLGIRIVQDGTDITPNAGVLLGARWILPHVAAAITTGVFYLIDWGFIFRDEQKCLHDIFSGTDVIEC